MSTPAALNFSANTALQHWFEPMHQALQSTRTNDSALSALPNAQVILSGCLRQLLATPSLREFVQTLFHHDSTQTITPVARSTWSDALSCPKRCAVLHQACAKLVAHAQSLLSDRLAHLASYLNDRAVIATDATYLNESAHYTAQYPSQGGTDNQKGHMVLSHFDLRHGIPLSAAVQTQSMGEMRVLKQAHGLGRTTPNSTQQHKHHTKQVEHKRSAIGVSLRASWTELSQIPRQLWRLLKNCFGCTHEPALYTRQLAPILERYL